MIYGKERLIAVTFLKYILCYCTLCKSTK